MKILVDGMPRTVGGIGSLILNIAEVAKNRNDDVSFDFIISDHSAYIPVLEEKGYKYFVAPRVKDTQKYREYISDIFENNKYDYLWFNNTSKVNVILPDIAKSKGGAKIITHPHGVDFEEKGLKRLVFKLLNKVNEAKLFSLIDVPLACSEEAADVYYKHNKKLREETIVVHNGIFVSNFSFSEEIRNKIRAELNLLNSDILLGAVGRLTKVKNYQFLIELIKHLPSHYKLIILGEGEEYRVLQQQIIDGKVIDRCRLLGKKDNVNEYLSAMDCFLMPSFNEGMPYSIIEAQANGLHCVISDTLSQEMAITDLVSYVSLNDMSGWINLIDKCCCKQDRSSYTERIREAGYSIEDSYDLFLSSLRAVE